MAHPDTSLLENLVVESLAETVGAPRRDNFQPQLGQTQGVSEEQHPGIIEEASDPTGTGDETLSRHVKSAADNVSIILSGHDPSNLEPMGSQAPSNADGTESVQQSDMLALPSIAPSTRRDIPETSPKIAQMVPTEGEEALRSPSHKSESPVGVKQPNIEASNAQARPGKLERAIKGFTRRGQGSPFQYRQAAPSGPSKPPETPPSMPKIPMQSNIVKIEPRVLYGQNSESNESYKRTPDTVDIVVVYMYNSNIPGSGSSLFARGKSSEKTKAPPSPKFPPGQSQAGNPSKTNNLKSEGATDLCLQKDSAKPSPGNFPSNRREGFDQRFGPTRLPSKEKVPHSDPKAANVNTASQAAGVNWLEDKEMLPCILPNTKIIGYGFDVSSWNTRINFDNAIPALLDSIARGRDETSSIPIVFIGHGYGNVLIQKLLLQNLALCGSTIQVLTAAVVLFEPPIRGWANSLMDWTSKELSVTDNIFSGLGDESDELTNIWNEFDSCCMNPNIYIYVYLSKSPADVDSAVAQIKGKEKEKGEEKFRGEEKGREKEKEKGKDMGKNKSPFKDLEDKADYIDGSYGITGQVATFSEINDPRFEFLKKLLVRAIRTRQLLGAAERGEEDTMKTLIDKFDDLNLANKVDQTALHVGAENDRPVFITTLLGSGKINLDLQDNSGNTALHKVVLKHGENSKQIAEELLKAGADPYVKNSDGETPDQLVSQLEGDESIGLKELFQRKPLVEGPRVVRKPPKLQPPQGDEIKACNATQAVATEIFHIYDDEDENKSPERHLAVYPTVMKLVYSPTTMNDIFESVRPANVLKNGFCRWYHIPANNMTWIENLFAKLDIPAEPWPGRPRDDGPPHSRSMNPQAAELQALRFSASNNYESGLVIMMPYISYEKFSRQQDIATLIQATYNTRKDVDKQMWQIDGRMIELLLFRNELERNRCTLRLGGKEYRMGNYFHNRRRRQIRRTLERSYYNMLSNQLDRDRDQTVTRASSNRHDHESSDKGLKATDIGRQISAYLNHDLPLHPRRTLDQSYYYMLPDTSVRDRDQVVTRRARKEARRSTEESSEWVTDAHQIAPRPSTIYSNPGDTHSRENVASHNILMVDQLWLWYFKSPEGSGIPDTLITSFPSREGVEMMEPGAVDNLQASVLRSQNIHSRNPILTSEELISRIISVCCRTLDRHQHLKSVEFLQMFQSTIGDAESNENELFNEFRRITNKLYSLHEEHRDYQQSRSDYLKILLNIHRECDLLKEIKDVLDEIKMIKAILVDQLNVLKATCYSKFFPDLYSTTFGENVVPEGEKGKKTENSISTPGAHLEQKEGLGILHGGGDGKKTKNIIMTPEEQVKAKQALDRMVHRRGEGKKIEKTIPTPGAFTEAKGILEGILHNVDIMEIHANSVENGLNHLLDLKQMQANLWEARSSREGAEETAKQGNTLIVFTVVTIIFLPLSFMASFFALGVDQFPQDDKGNTAWPLNYVCGLLFGISFALSLILLVVAFNIDWFKKPWDLIIKIWLKKKSLLFIKPLRYLPVIWIRTKGYTWYVRLSDSLYKCEKPRSTILEDKKQRRDLWRQGLCWRIKDNTVEFPDNPNELEGKQYWELLMWLQLYFIGEELTNEDGPELPKWAELPSGEQRKILNDLERNSIWREEQFDEFNEKLSIEINRLRFLTDG